jgi:heme iron utilization protein
MKGMASKEAETGLAARRLVRGLDRAALATTLEGWPYVSLVLAACGHDATPLLLLSRLAQHTQNFLRDGRASLLFDGTSGLDDPLTGPRVTVLGRIEQTEDPQLRARFIARHPSAETYAGFADFALYRLVAQRAHLVAGFGRIQWVEAADLLCGDAAPALAEAESEIVAHMNEDHREAVELYATRLLGRTGTGWRMTGIDPEGLDLRRGGEVARVAFTKTVCDAASARAELVRLAKEARRQV